MSDVLLGAAARSDLEDAIVASEVEHLDCPTQPR